MNDAAPAEAEEPSTTSGSPDTGSRQQSKKTKLIDDLLQSFDSFVFAQIAALYYFDNSSFLLLIRILSQILFVSSGSGPISSTPQLPPVLLANIFAIIAHIIQAPPVVESGSRGYLRGGILIDFVGQKKVSIWLLLGLDALVFAVQMLMCLAALAKYKEGSSKTSPVIVGSTQDLDSEEAGLLRDPDGHINDEQGIELRDMSRDEEQNQEPDSLHTIHSGEIMLVELNLWKGIQSLLSSRTITPVEDAGGGVVGRIIARLAAARSQTGSGD